LDRLLEGLAGDFGRLDLDPADLAMLEYVVKLTRTPGEMRRADVESLRRAVEIAGAMEGVRRVVSRVTVDVRSG